MKSLRSELISEVACENWYRLNKFDGTLECVKVLSVGDDCIYIQSKVAGVQKVVGRDCGSFKYLKTMKEVAEMRWSLFGFQSNIRTIVIRNMKEEQPPEDGVVYIAIDFNVTNEDSYVYSIQWEADLKSWIDFDTNMKVKLSKFDFWMALPDLSKL